MTQRPEITNWNKGRQYICVLNIVKNWLIYYSVNLLRELTSKFSQEESLSGNFGLKKLLQEKCISTREAEISPQFKKLLLHSLLSVVTSCSDISLPVFSLCLTSTMNFQDFNLEHHLFIIMGGFFLVLKTVLRLMFCKMWIIMYFSFIEW